MSLFYGSIAGIDTVIGSSSLRRAANKSSAAHLAVVPDIYPDLPN
jgi:hypothetical protein